MTWWHLTGDIELPDSGDIGIADLAEAVAEVLMRRNRLGEIRLANWAMGQQMTGDDEEFIQSMHWTGDGGR